MKKHLFFTTILFCLCATSCLEDTSEQIIENPESYIESENYDSSISIEQATIAATNFLNSMKDRLSTETTRAAAQSDILTISNKDDASKSLLVVRMGNDQGFVIMPSSFDCYPILAYSEDGTFNKSYDSIPELYSWITQMLNYVSHATTAGKNIRNRIEWNKLLGTHIECDDSFSSITLSRGYDIEAMFAEASNEWIANGWDYYPAKQEYSNLAMSTLPPAAKKIIQEIGSKTENYSVTGRPLIDDTYIVTWSETSTDKYGPLLTTHWEQTSPYNYALKKQYPNVEYLGCTAIALGQIIKYHQSVDGYNYLMMPDILTTPNGVLPEFLFDVGRRIGIPYYYGQSGASLDMVLAASKSFGYNTQTATFDANSLKASELPLILYGESSSNTGGNDAKHMWVCDGFDKEKTYVHYNIMIPNQFPEDALGGPFVPYNMNYSGYLTEINNYYVHHNWGWGKDYNAFYLNPIAGGYDFSNKCGKIILTR